MNLSTHISFDLKQRVKRHWVEFADTDPLSEAFLLPVSMAEHVVNVLLDGDEHLAGTMADLWDQLQAYQH